MFVSGDVTSKNETITKKNSEKEDFKNSAFYKKITPQ